MQRRAIKLGKTSIAVVLPRQVCQLIGITAGDFVDIELDNGALLVKKVEDRIEAHLQEKHGCGEGKGK